MNWESWEDPKNSLTAAAAGLALIRSCGITVSISTELMRSRIALSILNKPTRYWFSINSPTDLTRLFPKWSISSISPLPSFRSVKIFIISNMSCLRRTLIESSTSCSKRAFIFTRPTEDRSYLSESKNRPWNKASAVSKVGGSPGRITLYISTSASSLLVFLSENIVLRI